MARYLLDTNIVSNFRRARPHPNLMMWLHGVAADQVFMSVVTVAEMQCGIGQVVDGAVADAVERWLAGMLRDGQPSRSPACSTRSRGRRMGLDPS
jgi:predicted nucleic acid-binding protein